LALFNTKVRPIVENWPAWRGYTGGSEATQLEVCYEELRTLVSQDKVTALLTELERVSGS
jgi:hypothetical protein